KAGYECLVAHTGERSIELVEKGEPIDLILMDINLGKGMDGTEAARRILTIRDIPLVFLSCYTDPETVNKTEGITSYGYIVKNSGEAVILASIRMAFRLWEARQETLRASEIFRTLAAAGADTGEQVFRFLVHTLAILFQTSYAFISQIDPNDPGKANTLAVWAGAGFGQNFTYDLPGSPCAEALEKEECCVESDADTRYPNDRLLKDMGIKSYFGIALKGENDRPIGILAAMDTRPISIHPWNRDILRVLGERTRVELYRLRMEQELLKREKTFQSLLEGIPLPIFYKDRSGRYLGVNTAFCKLIKKSKEELIGKTALDIAPSNLARLYIEKDEELFHQETVQVYDGQVMDSTGTFHEVRFYKAPFRDEGGKVVGLVGVVLKEVETHGT
ncbi:MAG: PAS domain-containing protein, partial [Spirochaetes bacterium]|nr:PAS domain-containing protein [Spirochaetota bacterium]